MGKVVIAGGTGFVGKALVAEAMEQGHEIVVLTRGSSAPAGARPFQWDGKSVGPWARELDGAELIVNLCGVPIMKRWTPAYLETIWASRIVPTRVIGEAIAACANPPKAWVNASAIGWYGDTGPKEVTEASPAASDESARLCQAWEAAVDEAVTPKTRKVKLRVGIVLGEGGQLLETLRKVTTMFAGGPLGSGRQYMSWIHVEDLARLILWVADDADVHGAVNGTAPKPVTNADVMAAFRRSLGRPPAPAAPEWAVRGALEALGLPSKVILSSCRAFPQIAIGHGFEFLFPTIESALADLLGKLPPAWHGAAVTPRAH